MTLNYAEILDEDIEDAPDTMLVAFFLVLV